MTADHPLPKSPNDGHGAASVRLVRTAPARLSSGAPHTASGGGGSTAGGVPNRMTTRSAARRHRRTLPVIEQAGRSAERWTLAIRHRNDATKGDDGRRNNAPVSPSCSKNVEGKVSLNNCKARRLQPCTLTDLCRTRGMRGRVCARARARASFFHLYPPMPTPEAPVPSPVLQRMGEAWRCALSLGIC